MELTRQAKRTSYLIGFPIGIALLLLVGVAMRYAGSPSSFSLISLLLFALILSALFVFVIADRGIDNIKYYLVGAQALYFYLQIIYIAGHASALEAATALASLDLRNVSACLLAFRFMLGQSLVPLVFDT